MENKFVNLDLINLKGELYRSGLKLIKEELAIYARFRGTVCKKCGFIQGSIKDGWKDSYCEHFHSKIERIMKKKEKVLKPIFYSFILASTVQVKYKS